MEQDALLASLQKTNGFWGTAFIVITLLPPYIVLSSYLLSWIWLLGSPIFLIMYYTALPDTTKRWTLENIEKELGKPTGYYSYQNNLDLFTEAIARLSMNFDQKMRFHFACHWNSPFAALGGDLIYVFLMNGPVVFFGILPAFTTFLAYWFIESDAALTVS